MPSFFHVPLSVWNIVLEFCPRDWFQKEPSEVDRLRALLAGEQSARQIAEKRLKEVINERDQAVHYCMVMRQRLAGDQGGLLQQGNDSDDSDHEDDADGGMDDDHADDDINDEAA